MPFEGISCILLLIHIISTVRGFETVCKGQCTELSCPGNSEDQTNLNVLWKKQTGERVIWKEWGVETKGQIYSNRNLTISKNHSLVMEECNQSDQGVYILCINGQQSCEVTLLVNDKCKRSSEKQCGNFQSSTDVTQEHKDLHNETSLDRNRDAFIFGFVAFILILGVILIVKIKRNNTSENVKESEFKENKPVLIVM